MGRRSDDDKSPDLKGVVQSLVAPDFISAESDPKFTFTVLVGGDHRTLSLDLMRPGAAAVVPAICAAYQVGLPVKVWLIKGGAKDRVDWVQVPNPPKPRT